MRWSSSKRPTASGPTRSSRCATAPDRRLIVYVPQLEALLREAERPPRLLDALIRGRDPIALDAESPQGELLAGRPLPAAALTRLVDRPDDAEGVWMRADPIDLIPDLAAVWLEADARFSEGEWSAALSELLEEEGLTLDLTEQGRGYLRLDSTPDVRLAPPWQLAGNSLEYRLPEGRDAQRWRRLLNETQVILQQLRKAGTGDAAIPGSLWFWGGGALPDRAEVTARVTRVAATDPVIVGLAHWLGLALRDPGERAEPSAGELLEWPVRFEESADANLERLRELLAVAWRRLRFGRIRELELAGTAHVRRFTVRDAWRLWR